MYLYYIIIPALLPSTFIFWGPHTTQFLFFLMYFSLDLIISLGFSVEATLWLKVESTQVLGSSGLGKPINIKFYWAGRANVWRLVRFIPEEYTHVSYVVCKILRDGTLERRTLDRKVLCCVILWIKILDILIIHLKSVRF